MTTKSFLVDELIEFDKMYSNRFDWEADHTAWMRDIETNEWVLLSTNTAPDELISYLVSASVYTEGVLALHGWGAPVDDKVMPSKHAERRRTRIIVHVVNGIVSYAIRFIDSQLEVIENPLGGHFTSLIEDAIEYTKEHHPALPDSFGV